MKKKIIVVAALVLALFALTVLDYLPGFTVRAATAGTTGDIGFYVRAKLPENQIDPTLTYFDLRVRPGQTQTVDVEVVNETDAPITVDVAAISASTNRNGVIDYKTPGIRDKSLAVPFSAITTLENSALTIAPNSTATARATIALPQAEYDGVVLGGLVFTRRPAGQAAAAEGMNLQNVYSYVVGVKLSENDTPVAPSFELESVQGETVNYQPAMVHGIRNRTAAIAKGIALHVVVRDENGNIAAELERNGVDMAPNSVMPLAVTPLPETEDGDAGQTPGQLRPGHYTSQVTLEQGGQSWTLEQSFTVGTVQAETINAETVGAAPPQAATTPFTLYLIIFLAIAVVVILALFIILMRLLRRREETKVLNRLMRQRHLQLERQKKYGVFED